MVKHVSNNQMVAVIIVIAVALAIGVWGYFGLTKKLVSSHQELEMSRTQRYQDLEDKQALSEELSSARGEIKQLAAELESTKKQLDEVSVRLAGLEKTNVTLLEEKQRLEAKLHSLQELKVAIRLVKKELREQKIQEYLAKRKQQEILDAQRLASGNRGYLLRDGRSVYSSRIVIDVRPADTFETLK
ncbi:MAG: hypothetical protein KBA46_05330 [Candidatus Omnitrophica bacterium]|nr:hypothetical protein [Candidatus Omnitrophota bacterium]